MYLLLAWLIFDFAVELIMEPKRSASVFDGLLALGLFGFWWVYLPYRERTRYRKDPGQRGENVVQLSPEGISEKSSRGSNASHPWTLCADWRESKRVIVLKTKSGIFYMFPKSCLSSEQLEELRSTLAAHLPKK